MIQIPNSKQFIMILFLILFFASFLVTNFVLAQGEKVDLTISPPLIKINLSPGDVWSSSIKVVNNIPEDLLIYASVRDFRYGKEGMIEFIQQPATSNGQQDQILLSRWIEISSDPILIPGYQSREVPFTIRVPNNAEPGDHYAAILVGPGSIKEDIGGTDIRVTSLVSSLILANVQGQIVEAAQIKEFSTDKTFYQRLEVKFKVWLENIGSVHIQPRGEIKIYNLWGREKGIILINQGAEFEDILPKSIKKWTFIWKGEDSPLDIGRYKAVLTLEYGKEVKKTISDTLHFWVLPLIPSLGIFGGLSLLFILASLMIRTYIRRAVFLARKEAEMVESEKRVQPKVFKKPITEAIADFWKGVDERGEEKKREALWFLIRKHFRPSFITLIFILSLMVLSFYFRDALYFRDILKPSKSFKVIIEREGPAGVIMPPEEGSKEGDKKEEKLPETEFFGPSLPKIPKESPQSLRRQREQILTEQQIDKASFTIGVLNGSGIPGAAAKMKDHLREEGFKVVRVGNADSFNYQETLIIYKIGKEKEAELLNHFFEDKALLRVVENQPEDLVVIIGKD